MNSWGKKALKYEIVITGKTFNDRDNTVTLLDHASRISISKAGGVQLSTLSADIYGVSMSIANQVTTLQWDMTTVMHNSITVYAIDGDISSMVFRGNIVNAYAEYNNAPDVVLRVEAQSAYVQALTPVEPTTQQGTVKVSDLMGRIAKEMGLVFSDAGVTQTITDPYLTGSAPQKARELADAAGCDLYIDDEMLTIAPRAQPRKVEIPEISSSSGLVGYPVFDAIGVTFRCLYNPAIVFGGAVKLVSDVERACGQWTVTSIMHDLSAGLPGGKWFSTVRGVANAVVTF